MLAARRENKRGRTSRAADSTRAACHLRTALKSRWGPYDALQPVPGLAWGMPRNLPPIPMRRAPNSNVPSQQGHVASLPAPLEHSTRRLLCLQSIRQEPPVHLLPVACVGVCLAKRARRVRGRQPFKRMGPAGRSHPRRLPARPFDLGEEGLASYTSACCRLSCTTTDKATAFVSNPG